MQLAARALGLASFERPFGARVCAWRRGSRGTPELGKRNARNEPRAEGDAHGGTERSARRALIRALLPDLAFLRVVEDERASLGIPKPSVTSGTRLAARERRSLATGVPVKPISTARRSATPKAMFCCARLVTIKKTPGSVGFGMVDGQRVRRAPSQPSASRPGESQRWLGLDCSARQPATSRARLRPPTPFGLPIPEVGRRLDLVGRRLLINFVPLLCVVACGGASTHMDPGNMSAGAGGMSAGAGLGGACEEPTSVVPDLPPFEAPPINALGAYHVTFHNHCAQTVWPASARSGGLENSVVDTQLWLPLLAASSRTITVYGGVRELGFWGRTGCNFDQAGNGTCETGECGGFLCHAAFGFPASATAFDLEGGFQGGYNLGLHVEGGSCGDHECTANLDGCDDASLIENGCGRTIACSHICSASPACCVRPGCDTGGVSHGDSGDDLVVTFCP